MRTAVTFQTAPITKRVSADVTAVRFDTAVAGVMPIQVDLSGERLPSDVTCVWL